MKHGYIKYAVNGMILAAGATLMVPAAVLLAGAAIAAESRESADFLAIDAIQMESLGLKMAAADEARDYLLAVLPAVIMPPPNARVAVAATFPGTVIQTLAVEGQGVRRGDALAIIASREILTEAALLTQARSRLTVAAANAERLEHLANEGIIAGARADEAKSEHEQAKAEVLAKAQILDAVGADGARGTYTLKAPIDGVVAVAKIQTGAPIESMTAPFIVDSGKAYEVQAQVPERLIGKIQPGMRVTVNGNAEAKVTSTGTVVQPETRSALLKAEISASAVVTSGTSASAYVYAPAPSGAVQVPRSAVTSLNGEDVVFVRTGQGFVIRKVVPASAGGSEIVLFSGLNRGEQVAITGLSELKSIALAR